MLKKFHNQFHDCFNHVYQEDYSLIYLLGLLSDLKTKTIDRIALRFIGKEKVCNLQRFIRESPWDDKKAFSKLQSLQYNQFNTEDGMITIDSSEELKKGYRSPGVGRQRIGSAGKTDNGQSTVYLGFTGSKGYGLLHHQLYWPEKWFKKESKTRRKSYLAPEDLTFKTKSEIALDLLKEIDEKGFCCKWVAVDAWFGSNRAFLDAIKDTRYYFASLRSNMKVWFEAPEVSAPIYKGIGRRPTKPIVSTPSIQVKDILKHPSYQMEEVVLNRGAHGYTICEIGLARVIETRDHLPGSEVRLIVRKFSNDYRYALYNAPADTPKETLYRRSIERWPIEQIFRFENDSLGLNAFRGLSLPGRRRYITYAFMGLFFTTLAQQKFLYTTEKDPLGYIDVAYEPIPVEEESSNEIDVYKQDTPLEKPIREPLKHTADSNRENPDPTEDHALKEPLTALASTDTSSFNIDKPDTPLEKPIENANLEPLNLRLMLTERTQSLCWSILQKKRL